MFSSFQAHTAKQCLASLANLELYKSSTLKLNLPSMVLKARQLVKVVKNSNSDGNSPFDGYSDIMIYRLSSYFFSVIRKKLDFSFILFLGFALEVIFNYLILKTFDKLPITIYLFVILVGIIILIIITTELPQAGKGYEASETLIHLRKSRCKSKSELRYKSVLACKPVGYSTRGMFYVRRRRRRRLRSLRLLWTIQSMLFCQFEMILFRSDLF